MFFSNFFRRDSNVKKRVEYITGKASPIDAVYLSDLEKYPIWVFAIDHEEDYEEGNQLKSMVDMFRTNRAVLVDIVKTLRYLEDESSIEIKKVTFDDVKNKNILFIQVNGLIGTSNIQSNIEQDIINLIKEYINR